MTFYFGSRIAVFFAFADDGIEGIEATANHRPLFVDQTDFVFKERAGKLGEGPFGGVVLVFLTALPMGDIADALLILV